VRAGSGSSARVLARSFVRERGDRADGMMRVVCVYAFVRV
jgi:hypothetical protein